MVGKSGKAALIVVAFAMLGLIISLILEVLYEQQMIIHEYITEAAMLPALQTIIILICILLGIIMAALFS